MSKKTCCLVLGGRGFIGSHLVDGLLARGYRVRCFDRPHVKPLGDSHLSNKNFELVEGDFSSEAAISEAVDGCDICFHLISTTLPKSSNDDPIFDIESNLLGTVRLITNGIKSGIKKIIFISSGGTVYGVPNQIPIPESHPQNPICSYGIVKLAIEKYLALFSELYGLDYKVLRIANPFGERQSINASQGAIAVFLGKYLRNEIIEIWGDGSVVRDFIYIEDVVEALIAVKDYSGPYNVFNIGSGSGLSLNASIEIMEGLFKKRIKRNYLSSRLFDVPSNVLSISLAKRELDWSPSVTFEEGISRFANWLFSSGQIKP